MDTVPLVTAEASRTSEAEADGDDDDAALADELADGDGATDSLLGGVELLVATGLGDVETLAEGSPVD